MTMGGFLSFLKLRKQPESESKAPRKKAKARTHKGDFPSVGGYETKQRVPADVSPGKRVVEYRLINEVSANK